MPITKTLKIGFVSSSDFCIPIASEVLNLNGKTLNELIDNHNIKLNSNNYSIDHCNFEVVEPIDYQDVKSLLGEVNNFPIEFCIVVSQPDSKINSKTLSSPISTWAKSNNIPLWNPININKESNPVFDDLDLVVTASFGQLISQIVLDKPKYGFINWHPSLLPKYRGPTPMQSTILNQDSNYGLSWITMTKGMDAGKVLLQLENKLEPEIDFEQMATELGELGAQTLTLAILNQILGFSTEQDDSKASFCSKISKEDQIVFPKTLTADQVVAHQKAYIRFPTTSIISQYFDNKIKLIDCEVLDSKLIEEIQNEAQVFGELFVIKIAKTQIVYIECKGKTLLRVNKIKLSTGKQIDLSGYQFK
jgi:methionyl-tRNA formyltransferase